MENDVRPQTCSAPHLPYTHAVTLRKYCPVSLTSPFHEHVPSVHRRCNPFYSNSSAKKKEKGQVRVYPPVLGYAVWLFVGQSKRSEQHGLRVPPAQQRKNIQRGKEFKDTWLSKVCTIACAVSYAAWI